MIPWGFGGGVMIAALIYYFSGWVVLTWSGKCAECHRRQREEQEFARMGGIVSANGDYIGMEEKAWLRILAESATEMIEQRTGLDPEFDRGAVEQWRAVRDAATDLLEGYDSGRYGYEPGLRPDDDKDE